MEGLCVYVGIKWQFCILLGILPEVIVSYQRAAHFREVCKFDHIRKYQFAITENTFMTVHGVK